MRFGIIYVLVLTIICGNSFAITCGGDNANTYYIHYSCGDGTVATTLPEPIPVLYNQSVTPTLIKSQCTPPDDYVWAGQQIVVDGVVTTNLLSASATKMTYLYARDITIQPRFVYKGYLRDFTQYGGPSYSSNRAARTWTFNGWMGQISGYAICADVDPGTSNTISGYVPPQEVQAEIDAVHESASDSSAHNGMVCFCRSDGSDGNEYWNRWALAAIYSSNSACAGDCAGHCGWKLQQTSGTSDGTWLRRALTATGRITE